MYYLVFGNKRIGTRESREFDKRREHIVSISIDNREVVDFSFWGSYKELGHGYPFKIKEGTSPQIFVDTEKKIIKYNKEYLSPDGKTAEFTYTLKAVGEGKVELSWICTGPDGVAPWITFRNQYRDDGVNFDGKPVEFPDASALNKEPYKGIPIIAGSASLITYSSENHLRGFTIELPKKDNYKTFEYIVGGGGKEFKCLFTECRSGSILIDLGESSVMTQASPGAVAGIDFWLNDALHVPAPTTRNLLQNPSFEQGLRYWKWFYAGALGKPLEGPMVYSVVDGGLYGRSALFINPKGPALYMQSMPFPIETGKNYTVSFYAKGVKAKASVIMGAVSASEGSKYTFTAVQSQKFEIAADNWERKHFTFTSDTRGIALLLRADSPVMVDGMQIEEGLQPTAFVAPSVEGVMTCSEPHNAVEAGSPVDAKLILSGKPGLNGKIQFSVRDFYRRELIKFGKDFTLDDKGGASMDLPLDGVISKGSYVIKADIQPQGEVPRTDYYRISVFKSLDNTHPTKTIFGNLFNMRTTKMDELGKLYMRYGWGYGTGYGATQEQAEILDKYRISHGPSLIVYSTFDGFGHITDKQVVKRFRDVCFYNENLTDDDVKFVEETVYQVVSANPWCKSWALTTEAECASKRIKARKFDEHAKLQLAFWRGARRAMPDAILYPDGGTSGFNDARGIVEMRGYLEATKGKVKWDAIAVHPYGSLDGVRGTSDLDAVMEKLVNLMKEYGYGSYTPIDIDEDFNVTPTRIPEWGDIGWTDRYNFGFPSYDSGWMEYIHASWAARTYIMYLKYWPQLRTSNMWVANFVMFDQYLTPPAFCLVPNTLGNLFPNPRFKADIRPSAGVRGYAFEDAEGNCTVAIWCAMDKVDDGLERRPEIGVKFGDVQPQVFDLMANECKLPESKNGLTPLQLTSAPLFLRVSKEQSDKLIAALSSAEVAGVGSSLKVSVNPATGGKIEAKLENLAGNVLTGTLVIKNVSIPFEIQPKETVIKELPFKLKATPGAVETWKQNINIQFSNGKSETLKWDMSCFYVPHVREPLPLDPDAAAWMSIPAIPVNNWLVKNKMVSQKFGYAGDLDAKFQVAWDNDNLYLRVSCSDDKFIALPQEKWSDRTLYNNDGCVELYLDTVASGRSNLTKGYDQYDYRYDFGPSSGDALSGVGKVWRMQEVFSQLAGGTDMPTKEQAASGIKCEYRRNQNSYSYVMILPKTYIEPLRLEPGWRAGLGLYIHDKDEGEKKTPTSPEKGVSISTKSGEHCNNRPDLWPIMVLEN